MCLTLFDIIYLILLTTLQGRYYYYDHFMDEETEPWGMLYVLEGDFKPRQPDSRIWALEHCYTAMLLQKVTLVLAHSSGRGQNSHLNHCSARLDSGKTLWRKYHYCFVLYFNN